MVEQVPEWVRETVFAPEMFHRVSVLLEIPLAFFRMSVLATPHFDYEGTKV